MNHLSREQLSAHLDHALTGRERERVAAHLVTCEPCRAELEALAALDRALEPALEHDPGEAYFDTFAARVTERLEAGGLISAGHPAAGAARGGFAAWFSSPRRLALAGTVATVVVGGAIVLLTARQHEIPSVADRTLLERAGGREPEAAVERHAAPTPVEGAKVPGRQNEAPAASGALEREKSNGPGATTGHPESEATGATPLPSAIESKRRDARAAAPAERPQDALTPSPQSAAKLQARERAENLAGATSGPGVGTALKSDLTKPGRAYEVRRDPVTGEEVRVRREGDFTPPVVSAPVPSPANGGPVRVLKGGQVAQPMGAAPLVSPREQGATKPSEATAARKEVTRTLDEKAQSVAALEDKGAAGGLLCGMVRDPGGRAIAGAQVIVAEFGTSARTDGSGRFCVRAPAGRRTLSVMALGYEPSRQEVTFVESTTEMALTIQPVAVLEERRAGLLHAVDSLSKRLGMSSRGSVTGMPGSDAPGFAPPAATQEPFERAARLKLGADLQSGAESSDVFAALPDSLQSLARDAERTSLSAARRRSADQFDAAADRWERLLRQLRGSPAETETRYRIGEARFHAWEAAPSPRRASAAVEALTAYAVRAPGGAQRQQAARWLDRVK